MTEVTSAIFAETITAVARTHTPRHPASVQTEVEYLILIVFMVLISEFRKQVVACLIDSYCFDEDFKSLVVGKSGYAEDRG